MGAQPDQPPTCSRTTVYLNAGQRLIASKAKFLLSTCLNEPGFSRNPWASFVEVLQDSEDPVVAREVSLVSTVVITPSEVRVRHGFEAEEWGSAARVG